MEIEKLKLLPLTDLDSLMQWRAEVLSHVFGHEPGAELLAENRRYYTENVAAGLHLAVEALYDGQGVGCGAICLQDELPSPDNPNGRCAFLMNIYVREEWRGKGIATALVKFLIAEAKARKCRKIYLETTDMARGLYRSLGFVPYNDVLKLPLEQ